jgi:hypothetical protein
MKRSPLKRKAKLRQVQPLRRLHPMRQQTLVKRDRGDLDDPAYLDYIRAQMCRAPGLPTHKGGDPHHARHDERGAGIGANLKAHDHRAISLCREHHTDIDAFSGPFKGWDKQRMHAWVDEQIAKQRAAYLSKIEAQDQ